MANRFETLGSLSHSSPSKLGMRWKNEISWGPLDVKGSSSVVALFSVIRSWDLGLALIDIAEQNKGNHSLRSILASAQACASLSNSVCITYEKVGVLICVYCHVDVNYGSLVAVVGSCISSSKILLRGSFRTPEPDMDFLPREAYVDPIYNWLVAIWFEVHRHF